jgi:hypothetical protein
MATDNQKRDTSVKVTSLVEWKQQHGRAKILIYLLV